MSKQIIRPGGAIDCVTTDEMTAAITAALNRQRPQQYKRQKGIIALDANGNGQSANGDFIVPSQFDIKIERIVIGGPGAANALVCIYENQVNDADMVSVIQMGAAGKYSDGFSNCIYLPANTQVIIAVTGGAVGLQVLYNIQARLIPNDTGHPAPSHPGR